eukprot:172310-Pleurochrysis_carterae.AAC.2
MAKLMIVDARRADAHRHQPRFGRSTIGKAKNGATIANWKSLDKYHRCPRHDGVGLRSPKRPVSNALAQSDCPQRGERHKRRET